MLIEQRLCAWHGATSWAATGKAAVNETQHLSRVSPPTCALTRTKKTETLASRWPPDLSGPKCQGRVHFVAWNDVGLYVMEQILGQRLTSRWSTQV